MWKAKLKDRFQGQILGRRVEIDIQQLIRHTYTWLSGSLLRRHVGIQQKPKDLTLYFVVICEGKRFRYLWTEEIPALSNLMDSMHQR